MSYDLFVDYYEPDCSGFVTLRKDGASIGRYPAALGPEVAPGSYRAIGAAVNRFRTFRSGDGRSMDVVENPAGDVTLQPCGAAVFVHTEGGHLCEVNHITVRKWLFLFGAEHYRGVEPHG